MFVVFSLLGCSGSLAVAALLGGKVEATIRGNLLFRWYCPRMGIVQITAGSGAHRELLLNQASLKWLCAEEHPILGLAGYPPGVKESVLQSLLSNDQASSADGNLIARNPWIKPY